MKENKKIKRLLEGAEYVLIATDNGVGIEGEKSKIATGYTMLTNQLLNSFTKEQLEDCFNLAFMDEKELLNTLIEKLKKVVE